MKKILLGIAASFLAFNANAALINIYETNTNLGSIAQAEAVIAGSSGADTSFDSSTIFFSDAGYTWNSTAASTFPGGHTTTFVLQASGMVDTSFYSALWFGHDDGIDVDVDGSDLYTFNANTAFRNSGEKTLGASAGLQSFNLLFWENHGAATVAVWGKNRSTNSWEIANISTAASVSEPATLALFGLGLIGLSLTRRRAK